MTAANEFKPLSLCVLTVSDTRTADNDTSGDYLCDALRDAGHRLHERAIVRDDKYAMRAIVSHWIADADIDGILVTGGTGFTGPPSNCQPRSVMMQSPLTSRSPHVRWVGRTRRLVLPPGPHGPSD